MNFSIKAGEDADLLSGWLDGWVTGNSSQLKATVARCCLPDDTPKTPFAVLCCLPLYVTLLEQ